jgi:single-strand DNA-binding protein
MSKGTVNRVILVGRLGRDPEMRYSASGTAIAQFSLATDERVPAGEGNWEDRTEWHRIVAFGKLAERCGNYLNKGRQVFVEGSIRTRQWEDKEGAKRYTTEIVARDLEILSSPGGQGQPQYEGESGYRSGGGETGRPAAQSQELPPSPPGAPDDDIPF